MLSRNFGMIIPAPIFWIKNECIKATEVSGVTFSKPRVLQLMLSLLGVRQHSLILVNMIFMTLKFHCDMMTVPTTATKIVSVIFCQKTWFVRHTGSMDGSKLWPSNMIQGFLSWKRRSVSKKYSHRFSRSGNLSNIKPHQPSFAGWGILPMLSHEGPRMEDLYFT